MKPHRLDKFVERRAVELGWHYGEEHDLLAEWANEDLSMLVCRAMRGKTTYTSKHNRDSITINRQTDDSNYQATIDAVSSPNPIALLFDRSK